MRNLEISQSEPISISIFGSHGLVLFGLHAKPNTTVRELAISLGITERQVARLVKDLAQAGIIRVAKLGNRNTYTINEDIHWQHPSLPGVTLASVLRAVNPRKSLPLRMGRRLTEKVTALLMVPFPAGEVEVLTLVPSFL
jgi:DNA-binding Lrp family transcriptional regulator